MNSRLVRQHLDGVLASNVFRSSARHSALLKYLVDHQLAGATDTKEYSIGIDVFGRPESFDPKLDSIVRVEVTRLRARLAKYYEGEGQAEQVRLSIPKGGYGVVFTESGREPLPPMRLARRFGLSPTWGLGLLLLALTAGGIFWSSAWRDVQRSPIRVRQLNHLATDKRFPDISPDGSTLVYSQKDDGVWAIFRQRINAGEVVRLSPRGKFNETHATWSPDGKWLAFRSERDQGGIFVMDDSGGGVRRVAPEGYHPAWSPDGQRLCYSTIDFERPEERPTTDSRLWVVELATARRSPLTDTRLIRDAIQPSWSSDGRRIAFWGVDAGGRREIWTIAADGSGAKRVTTGDAIEWGPVWAPDGVLYFASNRAGSQNLWRARVSTVSGSVEREPELVGLPAAYAGHFRVTPDGKHLLYSSISDKSVIAKLQFNERSVIAAPPTPITSPGRRIRYPTVSPDGSLIAATQTDPTEDIVVFRTDGSEARLLTHDTFRDRDPAWSPDGRRIAFGSNRGGDYQLWAMSPDGGGLSQLTESADGAFCAVWSPDSQRLAWFSRGYAPHVSLASSLAEKNRGTDWPVPSDTGFRPMAWSADGNRVAGQLRSRDGGYRGLAVIDLRTMQYQTVAKDGRGAVWLANGQLIYQSGGVFYRLLEPSGEHQQISGWIGSLDGPFAASPDASALYVTIESRTAEIWMAELK